MYYSTYGKRYDEKIHISGDLALYILLLGGSIAVIFYILLMLLFEADWNNINSYIEGLIFLAPGIFFLLNLQSKCNSQKK